MVFPREAPRAAVEIMRAVAAGSSSSSSAAAAAAASSSSLGGEPLRAAAVAAAAMKGKPRSRLSHTPGFKACERHQLQRSSAGVGNGAAPPSSSPLLSGRGHHSEAAGDDRLERIRAKLMDHLREAAGRIELPPAVPPPPARREPPPEASAAEEKDAARKSPLPVATSSVLSDQVPGTAAAAVEELPWSLRTRRSTTGDAPPAPKPATRQRNGGPERREAAPRRRRPRFSVPLSKEEIDEDLYAFTGRRTPRRPKKRPRAVQKQLDMVFPGLWLSEVTAETYLVAEAPPLPPT
ncbi:unnamed protein product [Spirodela intermedia]|uniref:Uncharacterized protein n=1 Tax=Spirodela intermedia TaxID=51605 RepID=A0A7I8J5K1_SPIIN|nr:unnamed protein product [Spirodela intermedia]CAA6665324.1 unnamed protein product [Spirodela intermedia]